MGIDCAQRICSANLQQRLQSFEHTAAHSVHGGKSFRMLPLFRLSASSRLEHLRHVAVDLQGKERQMLGVLKLEWRDSFADNAGHAPLSTPGMVDKQVTSTWVRQMGQQRPDGAAEDIRMSVHSLQFVLGMSSLVLQMQQVAIARR